MANKKIIITSATEFELDIKTKSILQSNKKFDISFVVTGIGMLSTAVNLSKLVYEQKPDLIIQIGIAGCFETKYKLGETFIINKEYLGDLGVEENNNWLDIFDLKLIDKNENNFKQKSLLNKHLKKMKLDLPIVNAITINQISTNKKSIENIYKKYKPTIESMEGAALHFVGNQFNIPFLQIRSISNYIGERDKSKWTINLAIKNVNKELVKIIQSMD